jgi:hypothetical protein
MSVALWFVADFYNQLYETVLAVSAKCPFSPCLPSPQGREVPYIYCLLTSPQTKGYLEIFLDVVFCCHSGCIKQVCIKKSIFLMNELLTSSV